MNLTGKTAIVTGAASGIGRAVAEVFAEAGVAHLILADINGELVHEVAAGLSASQSCAVLAVQADVSREQPVNQLVADAVGQSGRVDILVSNAGICPVTSWDDTTLDDWNHVLQVNLTSAYLCTKAVLPYMRRQRCGRIVYISSAAAILGSIVAHVAYGVSKAGIIALMKSVAKEFGQEGVQANAIAPGSIDTPMADSLGQEFVSRVVQSVPLKRQGTPRELADAVLFLVSNRAGFVNGATLHVNGGQLLV